MFFYWKEIERSGDCFELNISELKINIEQPIAVVSTLKIYIYICTPHYYWNVMPDYVDKFTFWKEG